MQTLNVGAGRTDEEYKAAEEQRRADLRSDVQTYAFHFFVAAGLAAVGTGLILFKLKWLWALSKPLLLGFTKLGTLVTMLAALGAYWAAFGWKFALGFWPEHMS